MTRVLIISRSAKSKGGEPLASAAKLLEAQVVFRDRIDGIASAVGAGAFDAILFLSHARDDTAWNTASATQLRSMCARRVGVFLLTDWQCDSADRGGLLTHFDHVFTPASSAEEVAAMIRLCVSLGAAATERQAAFQETTPAAVSTGRKAADAVRVFSRLFRSALDPARFCQDFAENIRELFGVSRLAIFLLGEREARSISARPDSLKCTAAIGFSRDSTDAIALFDLDAGATQQQRTATIRRIAAGAGHGRTWDGLAACGVTVVIPISDRSAAAGYLVIGPPIVGADYSDEDLQLLYYLCEEAGIALKHGATHERFSRDRAFLTHVLDSLTDGALLAEDAERIVYANGAAARMLGVPGAKQLPEQLPATLREQLTRAPAAGAAPVEQMHDFGGRALLARAFSVEFGEHGVPRQLLLLEDLTSVEEAKSAAVDAANAKLIALIARRCAHEIRNAVVPLTTHAQLFRAQIADADFQSSLLNSLEGETERIVRFTDQMLNLSRARHFDISGRFSVLTLLDEAFEHARKRHKWATPPALEKTHTGSDLEIDGSFQGLLIAFAEILVNALQSGADGRVRVTIDASGDHVIRVGIEDNGAGFSQEAQVRAMEPFFTTRNVGVGLGLTIAHEIIASHGGSVEVLPTAGPGAHVAVTLPRRSEYLAHG